MRSEGRNKFPKKKSGTHKSCIGVVSVGNGLLAKDWFEEESLQSLLSLVGNEIESHRFDFAWVGWLPWICSNFRGILVIFYFGLTYIGEVTIVCEKCLCISSINTISCIHYWLINHEVSVEPPMSEETLGSYFHVDAWWCLCLVVEHMTWERFINYTPHFLVSWFWSSYIGINLT